MEATLACDVRSRVTPNLLAVRLLRIAIRSTVALAHAVHVGGRHGYALEPRRYTA